MKTKKNNKPNYALGIYVLSAVLIVITYSLTII